MPVSSEIKKFNPTNMIRGIAVFIYTTSHFRAVCWHEDPRMLGYSNVAVALFFIVSGFGIYHSLKRRESQGGILASLPKFWKDRFVKILPQHMLAVTLVVLLSGVNYSWWQYIGVESPFWAINQALQCYIAAPLLYALAKHEKAWVRWSPIVLWMIGNALFLYQYGAIDRSGMLRQFIFRNLYGTYLVMFHLGMLAARRPSLIGKKMAVIGGGPLVALWIGTTLVAGISDATAWGLAGLTLVGLASTTLFFHAAMALPQPIPGYKLFANIGRVSLSVNLFEPMFYFVLFRFDLLVPRDYHTVLWYAALIPLFYALCMVIQKTQNAVAWAAAYSRWK